MWRWRWKRRRRNLGRACRRLSVSSSSASRTWTSASASSTGSGTHPAETDAAGSAPRRAARPETHPETFRSRRRRSNGPFRRSRPPSRRRADSAVTCRSGSGTCSWRGTCAPSSGRSYGHPSSSSSPSLIPDPPLRLETVAAGIDRAFRSLGGRLRVRWVCCVRTAVRKGRPGRSTVTWTGTWRAASCPATTRLVMSELNEIRLVRF